ncbi:MAG: cell envelope integrity protein TolA [Thermodesulfovibrionales bacterium]|nr:cell envelope integrity protein TolA [Thermodesulfovibrionales bacterium]
MREPSIQRTAALSFAVHLVAFLIVVLVMRQSSQIVMPSPYIVQLVNPGAVNDFDRDVQKEESPREIQTAAPPAEAPEKNVKEKDAKEKMVQKKLLEEKMAVLAAKNAAKKKIEKLEKIVTLHKIISLKAGSVKKTKANAQAMGQDGGTPFDEYYSKITKEIWQEWVYPDIGRKDIEAVIAVKILKDGTAIVQRVEKSSGNSLFDKSAIKALAKASPLTPPPDEIELGVRFYP